MKLASIHPGDRVEVNRKGFTYSATLDTKVPAGWIVRGYLHVTSRMIVRVLESGVKG